MDQRDFDEAQRFLGTVGKPTLFAYFGAGEDAPADAIEAALTKRRGWAQGQQSNPKFRQEALWVIKNVKLAKRLMIDERDDYLSRLAGDASKRNMQVLRLFITGTLAGGVLTNRGEAAIHEQGEKLHLKRKDVHVAIEALLAEHKAERREMGDTTGGARRPFVDHYAVLGVPPSADLTALERAYRTRYKWARQLPDARRAESVYVQLDEAWAALKEPTARTEYDAERAKVFGAELQDAPVAEENPSIELSPAAARNRRLSFAEGETTSPMPKPKPAAKPAESSAPPSADAIKGRTLPLGRGSAPVRPERPAHLVVEEPENLDIELGRAPAEVRFIVRNTGAGKMPGRVFVDRDWVEVAPSRLDPTAETQEVVVTIDPSRLTRKRAVVMVTVVTDAGERHAVTLQAQKRSRLGLLIGLTAALAAAAAGITISVVGLPEEPPPPPEPPKLVVRADPLAGEVSVNGDLVSSQGEVELEGDLPVGTPVVVQVELDGFATWTDEVVLQHGKLTELSPHLELTDKMAFLPNDDHNQGDIDAREVSRAIGESNDTFDTCFAGGLVEEKGFIALLDISGYVNSRGYIVGLGFDNRNFESADVDACVKRTIRAIRMPLVQGDYASFRHSFRYTVTGRGSP